MRPQSVWEKRWNWKTTLLRSHLEVEPQGSGGEKGRDPEWHESFKTSKPAPSDTPSKKATPPNPSQTFPPSIQTHEPIEASFIQTTAST